MLWGKNKRGQKIGVINWSRYTVDNWDAEQLAKVIRSGAERVARESGSSLIVIVEVAPDKEEAA